MECPKCQHKNPEDAIFCNGCGFKLELQCPECSKVNPPGSRFCNGCGQNLAILSKLSLESISFDEKLDKIQRYLPEGLTEKILSQRDKIEGERKQVTVMFCDMAGFTDLVDRLGSEESYSIMDQVYEILIHKVHDYEGTVNEMTGDGIMALFGAPRALEDAPQRAIRSAMAIHREIAIFSDKLKLEKEETKSIKMRIGVHTGSVVVGTLGNDLRVEFKAVGDTVNLASRMEGLAMPGTTYVTEETFRLTEGFFRFEALGETEVKGKKEPFNLYRVIAASTTKTRFDVSAERGLTAFVGREREFELLLDGYERAKGGRGQAISIVAEAGVGKSRLLYEFRKAVTNEDATFLEGKCLSFSRSTAYHLIIDILKANFDIVEGDGDIEIREKVVKGLKILGADEALNLPYILELFSVKNSGVEKISLSPEAKKDQTIEALRRIVLKGSEIRPLILAYEDLHWADKSSEEVLKYVIENIPGARVLMIFTYRPEFVHTWGGKSYHSHVTLNRLSNRESLTMANHILGTGEMDRDLEELILEKTEGIPFFIEEFIKSLNGLEIIERRNNHYRLAKDIKKLRIPTTIQDVIMARVDSLPDGAKEVLQTSAAIEREFRYDLIKKVTGLPEMELLSNLSALKDSELLYERGIYPQSIYVFKHALTREVVYDSILTRKKKELHDEIGKSIEELYRANVDEYYGILAEHYVESENFMKGSEYSSLAAKKAQRKALFMDAIEYAEKGVACLEKLPRTEDLEKKIIDARVTLGLYYNQLIHIVKANEAIDSIADLALEHNYKRRISQIYTIKGTYAFVIEGDYSTAFEYLNKALTIAKEIEDNVSLWAARHWIGHAYAENCEFDNALHHLKKALKINVSANVPWGISIMKSCIGNTVYSNQGRVDFGYKTSQEGLRLADESDDTLSKAEAYIYHGRACYLKGFLDDTEEYLLKGIAFCNRVTYLWASGLGNFFLGETCFDKGEYRRSMDYYKMAISNLEHDRLWPSLINLFKVALEKAKVLSGNNDIDLESLSEYAAENKIKMCDGMMARFICAILINLNHNFISEAEQWAQKAIETDKTNGLRWWHLAMDYAQYSEVLKQKGELLMAKEYIIKAIEIYRKCGADGWVKKYEEEIASLS